MDNHNLLPIGAVERELGIAKHTLRAWERRYGFPAPMRDTSGARMYPSMQIERLRKIKRLIENGWRPGKLLRKEASVFGCEACIASPVQRNKDIA